MNWLLKALFSPSVLSISGGGGGGDSGQAAAEEEARKAKLRKRINALYGVRPDAPALQPVPDKGLGRMIIPATNQLAQNEYDALDPEALAAQKQMESEGTTLGNATRQYYADQLGRDYAKAERNTRFKLARQGLLGGSEDVFQQGEVKSDRDLGATRVDEAVRRAIADLTGQREQERLSAVNLVNAGAGDSAVSAAQAGLRNSLENVSTQQKSDIFQDLFTNAADVGTASNINNAQAALLARYRDRLATFFPASNTTSGRVTPSGG